MESTAPRRQDASTYLARALSATAAAVCIAAFVLILVKGAPAAPAAQTTGAAAVARLEASQARLADALAALERGGDVRGARQALRRARAAGASVTAEVKRAEAAGLVTDSRLSDAVAAHRDYVDAFSSVALRD